MDLNSNPVQFIPMTCPSCGGELMISSKLSQAVCNYCGRSFLVVENINKDEATVTNYLQLAWTAFKSNNRVEAYGYYTKALELDSENYIAWFGKASTVFWDSVPYISPLPKESQGFGDQQFGRIGQAEEYFEKALSYAPTNERQSLQEISRIRLAQLWGKCAQIIEQEYDDAFKQDETRDAHEKEVTLIHFTSAAAAAANAFEEIINKIVDKKDLYFAFGSIASMCINASHAQTVLNWSEWAHNDDFMEKQKEMFLKYSEKYYALQNNIVDIKTSKD